MKIGLIIWRMAFSGAENVANALVQQFRQDGHEVHIILTSSNNIPKNDCYTHNVTFEGIPIIRIIKRSLAIRKIVKKESFDVVVGFGHIDSIHMLRALPFVKVTKVACERMDPATYPFKKIQRIERNILYRMLDGIVLQTNYQKQYYDYIMNIKSVVIPNPVRNMKYVAAPISERKKELVTVARLDNAQKNHLFMFDCFEEFDKDHPGFILKLYGDGPDKKMYEKYISDHCMKDKIILCGNVDIPQKYTRTVTAFLLTSNHEGMPNALIEAMSMGLPCISTKCGGGGPEDLIKNWENGVLVNCGDKKNFVDALCKLADYPEEQLRIGKEARKITGKLSIKEVSAKWIGAFQYFQDGNKEDV